MRSFYKLDLPQMTAIAIKYGIDQYLGKRWQGYFTKFLQRFLSNDYPSEPMDILYKMQP